MDRAKAVVVGGSGPGSAAGMKGGAQRKMVTRKSAIRSEKIASLSHIGERIYWRLYWASDPYGTLDYLSPRETRLDIAPDVNGVDDESIAGAVNELAESGLIERWDEPDGVTWLHMLGHDEHQSAKYIGDRQKRQTPIPPSFRTEPYESVRSCTGSVRNRTIPDGEPDRTAPNGHIKGQGSIPPDRGLESVRPQGAPLPTFDQVGKVWQAIELATHAAGHHRWWEENIAKVRLVQPDADDDVVVEALVAVKSKAQEEGRKLATNRAWDYFRGAVRRGVAARKDATEQHAAVTTIDTTATDASLARFMAEIGGPA